MFLGGLALLLLCALSRELTKTDEHRYIEVARELFVSGDWLVCRLNGETYTHKPPGFFQAAALAHVLGLSWTLAAMAPSVLGGALSATLVFDMAHRLWGRAAAWAAAVVLITSKEHYLLSCRGNLDAYLALWTTLAAYAFVRATICSSSGRSRTVWTAVGFLAAGCGVMVKGPAAIAIPGAAVLAALIWDASWERTPWWRWALGCTALVAAPEPGVLSPVASKVLLGARIAAFVLLTGIGRSRWSALATWRWALAPLALLPGVAWAVLAAARAPEGWGYIEALAYGQGVQHAAGQVDKVEAWWFYANTFPRDVLPWTLFLPAAFSLWRRARAGSGEHAAADRFAMAWLVAPLVVMSMSVAKRDLYLVPVVPAAALFIGRMAPALAADASRFAAPLVRWSVRAFAAVGVLAGVALATIASGAFLGTERVVERVWQDFEGAHEQLPPSTWWAAAVTGLALIGASVALWRAADFAAAARRLAVVAGTLVVAVAFVYMPFTETASAPRPFLETVKARIGDGWLGDYGGTDFAANWVCERTVVPYVPNRREAERVLRETPGRVYFVLEAVRLPQKGLPAGTRVLLEDPRKSDARLVLIGRE